MLRQILRSFGIIKTTIGLTLISILLSVGITFSINSLLSGGPLGEGLAIAILAPALITPVMSIWMLRLLSELDRAEQKLKILSHTDELTQTYNRRYFMQCGEQEFKRARRYGEVFSLALLDLDNFKEINDSRGHLIGDDVLRRFCYLLKQEIRQTDIFARYGGDEFVFLFPQTNRQQALAWAERLYEKYDVTPLAFEETTVHLSFSIGMATFDSTINDLDDLLNKADHALYRAKDGTGSKLVFS
jgi:diguanylate cyclase (GGDEF)-like protein